MTRYVAPTCYAPKIQYFQDEDPEGMGSGEDQEEDEEELEGDGSLPSAEDLDGSEVQYYITLHTLTAKSR